MLQPPGIKSQKMQEEKVGGRIDWERVNASLPYQRGEEQQEERRKLCTLIPSRYCADSRGNFLRR